MKSGQDQKSCFKIPLVKNLKFEGTSKGENTDGFSEQSWTSEGTTKQKPKRKTESSANISKNLKFMIDSEEKTDKKSKFAKLKTLHFDNDKKNKIIYGKL